MTEHLSGTFDVTMTPQDVHAADAGFGRMSLAKRYHGDLDATGIGEMLAVRTTTAGSAAYVAIEKVDGTLLGRRGTFFLRHSATMDRGEPDLSVVIVPDSGTGELAGLSGELVIRVEGGEHFYDLEVEFDDD